VPLWQAYIEGKRLLMDVLMQKFVAFYRENALEKMFYHEITPHILLVAFLQRIINGGGQIIREYALGRKRLDLGIIFGPDKFAIEIKVKEQEKTWGEENGREKSLTQLSDYMDSLGINENSATATPILHPMYWTCCAPCPGIRETLHIKYLGYGKGLFRIFSGNCGHLRGYFLSGIALPYFSQGFNSFFGSASEKGFDNL
jgi:hypothetical protein